MEIVEDEEDEPVVQNNAPHNKARVLELADSSDDDKDLLQVVKCHVPAKNTVSFKLYTYQRRLYLLEKNHSHHSSMHNDSDQQALSLDVDSSEEDNKVKVDDNVEEADESSEAELGSVLPLSNEHLPTEPIEKLLKEWVLPIYVFFRPTPSIKYIKGHRVHVFKCTAPNCKGKANGQNVHCYLDTSDAKSTSNLQKHAKVCWGEDAVAAADGTKDVHAARQALGNLKDSSITAAFQ